MSDKISSIVEEGFQHAFRDIAEIAEDPDRRVAHEALLQLRMSRGDHAKARAATERYAASLGKDSIAHTVLAQTVGPRVDLNA